MRLKIAFVVLAGASILSCKKQKSQHTSDIASIDVVMQESLEKNRNNTCGINMAPSDKERQARTAGQKRLLDRTARLNISGPVAEDDIYGILAAVPDLLHKSFFQGLNGVVEARVDAQQFCIDTWTKAQGIAKLTAAQAARVKDLKGCYIVRHDAKGVPKKATIYVTSDYRLIHNSILPLFSFYFSEYFIDKYLPEYLKSQGANLQLQSQLNTIEKARSDLTKAMLVDLRTKPTLIKMYRDFFQMPEDIEKATPEQLKAFGSYLFAEAMDSRYCSQATLNTFKGQEYTNTYKAFAPVAAMFGKAWFEL